MFQSERGLVSMLKKYGEELGKSKGDNWLNDDFIMGVIMDMSAAGKLLITFFSYDVASWSNIRACIRINEQGVI